MPDKEWEDRLKALLKKTGEDFKRVGTDIKKEAQKLLTQARDPKTQQKVREKLGEVGDWAKKTGEELAGMVETGVKKAETVLSKASDKVSEVVAPVTASPREPKEPAASKSTRVTAPDETRKTSAGKKTVGKGKKKGSGKKPGGARKKTIGKVTPMPSPPGPADTSDDDTHSED